MIMSDMTEIEREELISTAKAAINDDPIAWFDELYDLANRDSSMIPWARMSPNPIMMDWVKGNHPGGKALIVGCGLGDDAVGLEELGFQVTAFDISQQCIDWCRERFPKSSVDWQVADILEPPQQWLEQFDLVVEIHILQAIPDGGIRELAAKNLPKLLDKDGFLLCIGRLDNGGQLIQSPPWPLKEGWLKDSFSSLKLHGFTQFSYQESIDVTRYYAAWRN